jgi:ABC-type sugar transport system ATPase subunit
MSRREDTHPAQKITNGSSMNSMENNIVLKMQHISKSFPGVKALDCVDFELRKGEVHAICGENGAGKSTLLKILIGIFRKDNGTIWVEGKEVNFKSIYDAKNHGIGVIPQEIQMAPELSVAENVFMANYPRKMIFFVDWKKLKKDTEQLQRRLGESAKSMGADAKVETMSMGFKQLIEIMKALSTETKILAFDEPTSSLSEEEVTELFKLINELKAKGISIIYVSHKLKEIFTICDRITVLKDGKYVGTKEIAETNVSELISMMVGRNLDLFEKKNIVKKFEEIAMEVRGLSRGNVIRNINFKLGKGEILGMFGIVGSGRTETARAIFGIDKKTSGDIFLKGKKVPISSPEHAVKAKIGFATEDRHGEGLFLRGSIRWNISLPFIKVLSKLNFIDHKEEKNIAVKYINALKIKTPSDTNFTESLSGGNQQKIVIAKWLAAESDILIFDEPTRGIDVGAKSEIYNLIRALANEGKSIIMISSELSEILALSDRVLVFKDGEIKAELENNELLSEEEILKNAIMQ